MRVSQFFANSWYDKDLELSKETFTITRYRSVTESQELRNERNRCNIWINNTYDLRTGIEFERNIIKEGLLKDTYDTMFFRESGGVNITVVNNTNREEIGTYKKGDIVKQKSRYVEIISLLIRNNGIFIRCNDLATGKVRDIPLAIRAMKVYELKPKKKKELEQLRTEYNKKITELKKLENNGGLRKAGGNLTASKTAGRGSFNKYSRSSFKK